MCQLTIESIEESAKWWNYVCTNCHEEVKEIDGDFQCSPCKRTIPYLRKGYEISVYTLQENLFIHHSMSLNSFILLKDLTYTNQTYMNIICVHS